LRFPDPSFRRKPESRGGGSERALREVVFPSLRALRLCGEILFFYFGCGVTTLGPWPFNLFDQMESLAQALIERRLLGATQVTKASLCRIG